ncbi:hypothetical protein FRC03_007376 [Tulasnella sp. 419]|nr:hypothetical protein FRC03_007376 [Tulasnella sp. 419]
MTRRRAMSEGAGLQSTAMVGLGIDMFPQSEEHIADDNMHVPNTMKSHSHIVQHSDHERFSMRSQKGMQGLLDAELGGAMVEIDPHSNGNGSGFLSGQTIVPQTFLPVTGQARTRSRSASVGASLISRNPTLLSAESSSSKRAAELKSLLGSSNRRLTDRKIPSNIQPIQYNTIGPSGSGSSHTNSVAAVSLEKAKSKARVEIDVELECEAVVEGGYLRGRMEVSIRKSTKNENAVWIGGEKLRVVGFEVLPSEDMRHTFFQHVDSLSDVSPKCHLMYASLPDEDGFCQAKEGTHTLPFEIRIPRSESCGAAKGVLRSRGGIGVQYIIMGSIKIKTKNSDNQSIAHFYRHIEIYPYFGYSILAPSQKPYEATAARSIFMGGPGKVHVTASLHRRTWIAGQRCYVHVNIQNSSSKRVRALTLTLIRTMTIFRPRAHLDALDGKSPGSADADACQTSTTQKVVGETTLEMGQKGSRGCVTAKGWWTGVEPDAQVSLSHFVLLPSDALTVSRGRLIEVDYHIRVSVGAGSLSSDIQVTLPLRIISYLSIDPPPCCLMLTSDQTDTSSKLCNPSKGLSLASVEDDAGRLLPRDGCRKGESEYGMQLGGKSGAQSTALPFTEAVNRRANTELEIPSQEHHVECEGALVSRTLRHGSLDDAVYPTQSRSNAPLGPSSSIASILRLSDVIQPPPLTPYTMNTTSSAYADDELDTSIGCEGLEPTLGKSRLSTPLRDSLLLTEYQCDMSQDGAWEVDDEFNQSMGVTELSRKALGRLGSEEYLLETSLALLKELDMTSSPQLSPITTNGSEFIQRNTMKPNDAIVNTSYTSRNIHPTNGELTSRGTSALYLGPAGDLHHMSVRKTRPKSRLSNLSECSVQSHDDRPSAHYRNQSIPRSIPITLTTSSTGLPIRSTSSRNQSVLSLGPVTNTRSRFLNPVNPASTVRTGAQRGDVILSGAAMASGPTSASHSSLQSSSVMGSSSGSELSPPTTPMSDVCLTKMGPARKYGSGMSSFSSRELDGARFKHRKGYSVPSISSEDYPVLHASIGPPSRMPVSVGTRIAQLEARNPASQMVNCTLPKVPAIHAHVDGMRKSFSATVLPEGGIYGHNPISNGPRSSARPGQKQIGRMTAPRGVQNTQVSRPIKKTVSHEIMNFV